MKAKANPKAVGAFVVLTVLLAVAVAAVFGSGRFFTDTQRYVLFFEGNLQGLNVGSPVQFRGVSVGEVTEIQVVYEPESFEMLVAAVIDFEPNKVEAVGRVVDDPGEEMRRLIARGLRAQLATRSMVTGQQAIQLVFQPDSEARLIGLLPGEEIPTVEGGFGQIQQAIETEGPELVREARTVVQNAGKFLSEDNQELVHKILVDVSRFTGALGRSEENVEAMLAGAAELVANADETVVEFGDVAERANVILEDNEEGLKIAIDNVGAAGGEISKVAGTADGVLEENRDAIKDFTNTGLYELTNLIQDTQDLVEDVRRVVADLERDPARFLFGDQQQGVETQ